MSEPAAEVSPFTTASADRVIDLDVSRAVALIGVALMNYQGYLLLRSRKPVGSSVINHALDPWHGPLATRFAATFVVVAGMGVTLMTNRVRNGGSSARRREMRWVLVRRGVLLYAGGAVLEWIWNGTILFFYGAYFMLAAVLFMLGSRWLIAIGATAAVAGHLVALWADGRDARWLFNPGPRSPRGLLLNTFVNGTHPLLPWLAFFILGILLGRLAPWSTIVRTQLALGGVLAILASYSLRSLNPASQRWSTEPYSRSLVYTLGAGGAAVLAIAVTGAIANATRDSAITRGLAAAGRMTLTLYIGHALFFNLVVNVWHWVRPAGLDVAAALALGYWAVAITIAAWWQQRFGMGPAERFYRAFGGSTGR